VLEGVFEDFYKEVDFIEGFISDITTVVKYIFDTKLSCLNSIIIKGSKRIEKN
jgi:hypothetical protein